MNRGEIWLVELDPTQEHEQKGRRPVLIVSPQAFNRLTKVPVVLPITSGGNFARTAGFAVTHVHRREPPNKFALRLKKTHRFARICR